MSTSYETILVETHGQVGLARINRPKARNALNSNVLHELNDALEIFDADPTIGAMVITGDDQAFAAGADIKEMADATSIHMLTHSHIPQFDRIRSIHKPIIAAVSGWCLGGGNELAMACDMIIASETARFGQPEINLGVIPGAGGTQRLTHAVGKAIAMEMVLNNRILTAEEAPAHLDRDRRARLGGQHDGGRILHLGPPVPPGPRGGGLLRPPSPRRRLRPKRAACCFATRTRSSRSAGKWSRR